MLGYLDWNQEQLMRVGLPVSAATRPGIPHDFAEVDERSSPIAACHYGLFLALAEGSWHSKWHPRNSALSPAWGTRLRCDRPPFGSSGPYVELKATRDAPAWNRDFIFR
jgi:hypothetical protein